MACAATAFIDSSSAAVLTTESPLFDHAWVKSPISPLFAFDGADSSRFWAARLRSNHIVFH